MVKQFRLRGKALFERLFPERQIYHRSGGTVRYVTLSPWKQALYASGASLVAGWCLYATVNTLTEPDSDNQNSQTEARYQRWLNESRAKEIDARQKLEARTEAFEAATSEYERRHATLVRLLDSVNDKAGATEPALARDDGAVLVKASIEDADPRTSRYEVQSPAAAALPGFQSRIARLRAEQDVFLSNAEESSLERSDEVRAIIKSTGLNPDRLVGQTAVGGPLLALDQYLFSEEGNIDAGFTRRVRQVAARLDEARQLEQVLRSSPLGIPVLAPYRETSGFGGRFDPFTGRPALHAGLDLVSYHRAPITTSAPGKIVFAGPRSGYGLLVEIDHGFGFHTRYGHLAQINVRPGQAVAIGDRIGAMGSTGRSTGTHLHYEVVFDGRHLDPQPFLRAGQYVRKG